MRSLAFQLSRVARETATFFGYALGLGLVAAGAWLIAPAAGLIAAGVALTVSVVLYELRPRIPRE